MVTWSAAVHEKQVIVDKTSISKTPGIIHLFVQTYDVGNILLAKICKVRFWSVEWITYSNTTGEL